MHPLFEQLTSAMRPPSKNVTLLESELIQLLSEANMRGLSLERQGFEGYKFVGPHAADWEEKIRKLAKSSGQNWQEMEVDMKKCIAEARIQVL